MPRGSSITTIIREKIEEILKQNPQGLRFSDVMKRVKISLPDSNINTIDGQLWRLFTQQKRIYRPERGLYRHSSFKGQDTDPHFEEIATTLTEEDFYKPFALYLVEELGDCTEAIALGGNIFGYKWGTPDVIGKNQAKHSDIIKHETEIVSAEIKIDGTGLITAFGQACAYKLFSHKVYIVIPKNSPEEDKVRIESLCLIFGIGLVLFDHENKENPSFEIRTRPIRHEPDMFYVNKYMTLIEDRLFGS